MNKKTVLIHGAINTSNFGDVLFAKLFYDMVLNKGDTPVFLTKGPYGISDFNIRELDFYEGGTSISPYMADELILMSGGYFGDNTPGLLSSINRWFRYFKIGLIFVIKKKKIYILGVGGAPLYSWFNRLSAKIIMNHAEKITVRDDDTSKYFSQIGVRKSIHVTADTALAISKDTIPELDELNELNEFKNNRKSILIHLTGIKDKDDQIGNRIIPGVSKFLSENSNYCVILTYDNVIDREIESSLAYRLLKQYNPYIYSYRSAIQLCSLIKEMGIVVTTKLHVGIIGCNFGCSVLSFPMHLHKTARFYELIGAKERCYEFSKIGDGDVYNRLIRYCNSPIHVPNELRRLALENLRY